MRCIYCDQIIPDARLKALPDTQTCVNCSDTQPLVPVISGAGIAGGANASSKDHSFAVMSYSGKGSLLHNARMKGRFRGFGCKTASDFGSQAYWASKNTDNNG